MSAGTWTRRAIYLIFGAILLFSIIDGIIATGLVTSYNRHHDYPSISIRDRTRFLVFTSWWTVFFSAATLVLFLWTSRVTPSILITGAVFLLTWVFWTAGVGSLTSALGGVVNCGAIDFLLVHCNALNALEIFAWIVWAFVTIGIIVILWRGVQSRHRGDGLRGSVV